MKVLKILGGIALIILGVLFILSQLFNLNKLPLRVEWTTYQVTKALTEWVLAIGLTVLGVYLIKTGRRLVTPVKKTNTPE
jgi:hypothetical protein